MHTTNVVRQHQEKVGDNARFKTCREEETMMVLREGSLASDSYMKLGDGIHHCRGILEGAGSS